MNKFMKKAFAVLLAIVMVSSSFVCLAAVELNQDAVNAHYGQYEKYLLLGDSAASGYRDEITDNDADFNEENNETVYCRVPGSYADVLSNAIIADQTKSQFFAAPGFRTIEVRYMLEDDFAAACEDEYLFHTSHLYVYEDIVCDCHGENLLPGAEHFRQAYKAAIADADLITLGVGGNDWGAYLTWVIADLLEAENVADEYIQQAQEILEKSTLDLATLEQMIEIAHIAGALPTLLTVLPDALNYGLQNFYENWDIMIQDIYDLNPDVTLLVLGMSDNGVKGKYYDYNGVTGGLVDPEPETDEMKVLAMNTIVEFIMTIGNAPMKNGVAKFGYTYVDTAGTTYVESHPDKDGHVYIANKIIEALPDAEISKKFEDVTPGHKYYNAVEYVVKNGIMQGTTDTTFSPDEALTSGQLTNALAAITGTEASSDTQAKVSVLKFAVSLFGASAKKGITSVFKGMALTFKILVDYQFNMTKAITRGEAANYLRTLGEI